VQLATVDCTAEKTLAQRFGVKGYPSIKLIKGGIVRDFKGARDLEGIVQFAQAMSLPPVVEVNSNNLTEQIKDYAVVFMFLGKAAGSDYKVFLNISKHMQGMARFVESGDSALFRKYVEDQRSGVVMFSDGLDDEVYDDDFDPVKLDKWIRQRQFPLVSNLGGQNFDEIVESGLFVVVGIHDGIKAPQTQQFIGELKNTALSYRGRYHFGFIEASHWTRWLQSMSVSTESDQLPTVIVLNSPKEQYYLPEDQTAVRTKQGISQFLSDIQRGYIRAQGPSEWSPSRIIKRLDEWLTSTFTEMQILVGVSLIMGIFAIFMIYMICSVTDAPVDENAVNRLKKD
jgi:hypothetical protein